MILVDLSQSIKLTALP